jgi:hypothetical protein
MSADARTQPGAFVREQLIGGLAEWYMLFSFWFDGETYEYAYSCGSNWRTEAQAAAISGSEGHRLIAQSRFLAEVPLEVKH